MTNPIQSNEQFKQFQAVLTELKVLADQLKVLDTKESLATASCLYTLVGAAEAVPSQLGLLHVEMHSFAVARREELTSKQN